MKTFLITGSAGLIGSNFCKYLLNKYKDCKIIGIDNLLYNQYYNLPNDSRFVNLKINLGENDSILSKIFEGTKIDIVYHFASFACEGLSPFVPMYNFQNVLLSSVEIISQCIKHNIKIVYASSMAVYGNQIPPFTEEMDKKPVDPYGIAKASVEDYLQVCSKHFKLKYTIVRPHNVGGIGQLQQGYRNVISIFIKQALEGNPLTVFGDGMQRRAFSDIDYYLEPLDKLADEKFNSSIFNIGADKDYSINELAITVSDIIKSETSKKCNIIHLEERMEVKNAYCDHTKAKTELNFVDKTNLKEMIKKMVIWNIKNKNVLNNDFDINLEIENGIYAYWKK